MYNHRHKQALECSHRLSKFSQHFFGANLYRPFPRPAWAATDVLCHYKWVPPSVKFQMNGPTHLYPSASDCFAQDIAFDFYPRGCTHQCISLERANPSSVLQMRREAKPVSSPWSLVGLQPALFIQPAFHLKKKNKKSGHYLNWEEVGLQFWIFLVHMTFSSSGPPNPISRATGEPCGLSGCLGFPALFSGLLPRQNF